MNKIIDKAVRRAIKNGWLNVKGKRLYKGTIYFLSDNDVQIWEANKPYGTGATCLLRINFYEMLFADPHHFAKALWGTELLCNDCGGKFIDDSYGGSCRNRWCIDTKTTIEAYTYHVQQAAISEDAVEYLKGFLITE